jgi:hypothetical protein
LQIFSGHRIPACPTKAHCNLVLKLRMGTASATLRLGVSARDSE